MIPVKVEPHWGEFDKFSTMGLQMPDDIDGGVETASGLNVDELLARFPSPLVLKQDWYRWTKGILMGLCLFLFGLLTYTHDKNTSKWLPISFMVSGGIIYFIVIQGYYSGRWAIKLDVDGFYVNYGIVKKHFLWRNVDKFMPQYNPFVGPLSLQQKDIGIIFSITNRPLSTMERHAGYTSGIGNPYGLSSVEFVRLMTTWRARALAEKGR